MGYRLEFIEINCLNGEKLSIDPSDIVRFGQHCDSRSSFIVLNAYEEGARGITVQIPDDEYDRVKMLLANLAAKTED